MKTENKIETFLAEQIRDISSELILDAIENGDAFDTLNFLREQITVGWMAALDDCGTPDEIAKKFSL